MAKITFTYDSKGYSTSDMHIVIGETLLVIKDGDSASVDVPAGEYEVLIKCGIRFIRLKVNADKDVTVKTGWDAKIDKPCAKIKE